MKLSSASERTLSPTLHAASVRLSREVSASPRSIFDAWLNAEDARKFLFADRIGRVVSSQIDPRVGGRFRIVQHRDEGDVEYTGEYLDIDRPHRLVFSLFVEKYAQRDDRVTVELAPVEERSLIVLTHEFSLRNAAERFRIQHGWVRVLDLLVLLCSGGALPTVACTQIASAPHHRIRPVAQWN
jgi:uncharacterized protein YndB with AHSA1/START domain